MYGERLKLLRNERGMTQVEFALYIGKSLNGYRLWENESNEPGLSDIIKMSDFYGVTIDYLLGRSADRGTHDVSDLEKNIYSLNRGAYDQAIQDVNLLFWNTVDPRYAGAVISKLCYVLTSQSDIFMAMKGQLSDADFDSYNGTVKITLRSPVKDFQQNHDLIESLTSLLYKQFNDVLEEEYERTEAHDMGALNPNDPHY